MPSGTLRRVAIMLALTSVLTATACAGRGVFTQEFEYEEEIYLQLDGSATAYVNASVPALVSLRGAQLNVDPRSRPERDRLRALFAAPGARVTTPTFSRRNGRRFVHVRVDVDDVRQLARHEAPPPSQNADRRRAGSRCASKTRRAPASIRVVRQ